ncbi:sulfatase-like hydrolase/transferase [Mucilaginibacter sabulilitoris]|uniref:Sulfatase-like hydrolase/transferase n=1 Tax=Mucilaginibacter sabulilitoris TaxID=1173583 RepID=A0ABZ0TJJ6_9SPHI|nr:sulfatase-like hydrolase/transferase [Mucilaginibacter sabulilitoris]WPU92602.1 sulfatase-like hydrolase/transferase [Mucilaginibacter sabulilitoris]
MLRNLFSFIRFFVFWLVFFAITRATFEIYFFHKLKGAGFGEILQTFIYGIRLDASTAAYICTIPLLVFAVNWCIPRSTIKPIWLKVYVWFCLFCISLNTVLNFNIFREWGTKVTFRVFSSLYHAPSEALASTGSSPVGRCIVIGLLLMGSGILLSNYIINYQFKKPVTEPRLKAVLICLLLFINFLFMRGGLQTEPINQNAAYFSDREILNQCALNTEWNLFNNIFENFRRPYNPYLFMQPNGAKQLVQDIYSIEPDSTPHVLTTSRPNVVIIQLESYTASIIESLGGDKGVAPNFEKFIRNGILFNNIYSSADRTDKGIISIMSGFPSQAIRTVIADTSKQKKLPALSSVFKNAGYQTTYFYGGKSNYMDFNVFMKSHHIDHIIDELSFDKSQVKTEWGVYDDVLLNKHLQYNQQQKQPFFSYLQTSTNHEPFVLPVKGHFPDDDADGDASNKFRSTAYFTDSCLNAYFEQAKKQSWYKNTLFILVADHGHRLPRNISEAYDPAKYHIPLLFFGDVIKPEYRGKKINKLGGQTDIAATLLSQLGMPHDQFKWSKNLLNPGSSDFAFFDWDNGFAFMLPQQTVSYDNSGRRIVYTGNKNADQITTDKTLLYGKAFLQQVYTEYMAF